MPLYEAQRHERLIDMPWDEARTRATIEQIAADAHRAFSAEGLWPIHPFDLSPERPPDSLKTLYYGAAGVIWALKYLDERGAIALKRDYLPTVRELIQRSRDDLGRYEAMRTYMGRELASFFMGEAGILLLQWKLEPSDDVAQHLSMAIEEKIGDARGLVWGAAGTMLAALFMHGWTGESRWKALYLHNFEALWDEWKYAVDLRCHLWTSELYGVWKNALARFTDFWPTRMRCSADAICFIAIVTTRCCAGSMRPFARLPWLKDGARTGRTMSGRLTRPLRCRY